jgi:sugar/nucleoside kinase (ribokinase family)
MDGRPVYGRPCPGPIPPMTDPAARSLPEIVVVGAASRDIVDEDPRGWRLGGGVSYSALTLARLGLPTRAIVGVDADAADAPELDLLRDAGVDLCLVRLARGPVFVNVERPEGRLQIAHEVSDAIPVDSAPAAWRDSRGWLFAPVADEVPDAWAEVPREDAFVTVGWQGLLRRLVSGEEVHRVRPGRNPVIGRADLAGISQDDVHRDVELDELLTYLRRGAKLVVTQSDRGGIVAERVGGSARIRRYPPVPAARVVDPTGAGDTFLAALTAARVEPRLVGGRIGPGYDLLLAASAASLVLEGHGLTGVPDRSAVRNRMSAARRALLS